MIFFCLWLFWETKTNALKILKYNFMIKKIIFEEKNDNKRALYPVYGTIFQF